MVTMTLSFDASVALGSALELLLGLTTELVVAACCIKIVAHHNPIKKWFILV